MQMGESDEYKWAREIYFQNVKIAMGFDQCRFCASAAAPIALETLEYFMSLGIFVYEVYGMSETTGPATWNRPGKWKIGTIGETIEGVKFKLNEDSEMLFQGKTMMKEYKDNPEATKKTVDPMTGWLATGDVGDIDEDGFISITERKKEILITAGGENVAPAIQESKVSAVWEIENGEGMLFSPRLLFPALRPTT